VVGRVHRAGVRASAVPRTWALQGLAAAVAGSVFVHVEMSATARRTRSQLLVDAIAGADVAGTRVVLGPVQP
jgi:ribose/xylose/arabinose/galactoside ABC-type transport system permease subunit